MRTSRASTLPHRSGTTCTSSRRKALLPSPTITSCASSTGAMPLQRPSRRPMLSGMPKASRALLCTSARYSAISGVSSRPRLTYNAVSTSSNAQRLNPQRVSAAKKRVRRSMSGGPFSNDRRGWIQPLWYIRKACGASEQHHVVLFLGVHGFYLKTNRTPDKAFKLCHIARLFIKQAVYHALTG